MAFQTPYSANRHDANRGSPGPVRVVDTLTADPLASEAASDDSACVDILPLFRKPQRSVSMRNSAASAVTIALVFPVVLWAVNPKEQSTESAAAKFYPTTYNISDLPVWRNKGNASP